jgi:UTP:GlnB (protein PII) uridylyltransferase
MLLYGIVKLLLPVHMLFGSAVVHAGEAAELHTVFQIAGPETPGLLAEVTQLLSHNGLEIRTAAVRGTAQLDGHAVLVATCWQ